MEGNEGLFSNFNSGVELLNLELLNSFSCIILVIERLRWVVLAKALLSSPLSIFSLDAS